MTRATVAGSTSSWYRQREGVIVTLRLIGGWGNRSDDLPSCVERVQRSVELMPAEPDVYHPWGVWQPQGAGSAYRDLVPIDIDDIQALTTAIAAITERVNDGPMTSPGQHIKLTREGVAEPVATEPQFFDYTVRAGFVGYPEPFNHLLLEVADGTDEAVLTRYLSACVIAWEPDHLSVATRATQRAQGHRPPQAVVGWLTYVRAGTPLDTAVLDEQIAVAHADGGTYITVPGTPESPSLDHIRQVRAALGYPD